VPHVVQNDWECISKHVFTVGEIYPLYAPSGVYLLLTNSTLVLLYVPFYVQSLPLTAWTNPLPPYTHDGIQAEQAEYLHRL
jgi:hypothetical protein